jgi:hypothetical protein
VDGLYIYGSYVNEFNERFLKGLKSRSFEERTFRFEDVKDITEESRPSILEKVRSKSSVNIYGEHEVVRHAMNLDIAFEIRLASERKRWSGPPRLH